VSKVIKGFLRSNCVDKRFIDPEDSGDKGGYSPKGKRKKYPKFKKSETENLRKVEKSGQTFQKETRKWLWVGLEPTRPERENVNTVKVSTFRNCWGRLGSSFISRVISTWDLVRIWKNSWNAEIRGSVDWTNNTTWITFMLRIYRTSGKPTPRWSRPSTSYQETRPWPKESSKGSCKPRKDSRCKAFFIQPLCKQRECFHLKKWSMFTWISDIS